MGGSGGVVNSLDLYTASLKSLSCFLKFPVHTFFTMERGDSEFAKFTVSTLKAFLKALVRVCLLTSNNLLLVRL